MKLKEIDEKVKEYWQKNNIEEKVLKARQGKPKYYFLDGPPYASGHIHVGTALNKIIKDFYLRYYRMKGFDVRAQPGYDCHGMPIELKVERELGVKEKSDIEKKIGVEEFIKKCREFATKYIDVMSRDFEDLGVWMDWDNPYLTLDNDYMESAWFTFKKAYEKGLLFKDIYPVTVCPHCETVVAYNEIEYKPLVDTSIYVKFPVKGKEKEYLVIWTTTPWTLPANTGIMAHPEFDYAKLKDKETGEVLIIAYELKDKFEQITGRQYEVIDIFKGKELEGLEYEHPFADEWEVQKGVKHKVVMSDQFVTLEKGTGLVHTAPGHGLEDYKVGKENGLAVLSPVDMSGRFTEGVGKYVGRFVKDCDAEIIKDFEEKGLLVATEQIGHEYPTCWRCESPLLFISVPQWFFRVTSIRDKLIEENKKVKWSPEWAGKRFQNWLESLDDWPISRQRYWGIPLPIWVCECGEVRVVGSVDELPEKPEDLHKPYIDRIVFECPKCGKQMKRIPDVLDVWFDSGVASWASLKYPKEKKLFEELWPAKLIIEGIDQFRGWYNSQMIAGVITFDRRPFEQVVVHGFVLEEHGKSKLSKSKGGVSPRELCEKYSRDVVREYFLGMDTSLDFNFSWDQIKEGNNKLGVLFNLYSFVKTYCGSNVVSRDLLVEDKWILSKLNKLIKTVDREVENLRHYKAVQAVEDFMINDFSKTYVKLVRPRVKASYEGEDKNAAIGTMRKVLEGIIRLYAPVAPHLTEFIYLDLFKEKESIHLEDWPEPDESLIDEELEKRMDKAMRVVEAAASVRNSVKINLRQPLRELVIVTEEPFEDLKDVIARQANVKKVTFSREEPEGFEKAEAGEIKVFLDTRLDDELLKEGLTRELIRRIQQMRKEMGLVEKDKVRVSIIPRQDVYYDEVMKAVNAEQILDTEIQGNEREWLIKGQKVRIIVEKL